MQFATGGHNLLLLQLASMRASNVVDGAAIDGCLSGSTRQAWCYAVRRQKIVLSGAVMQRPPRVCCSSKQLVSFCSSHRRARRIAGYCHIYSEKEEESRQAILAGLSRG